MNNNVMIGYVVPPAKGYDKKIPKFVYNKKSFGYIYRPISERLQIDFLIGSYGRDNYAWEFHLDNPDTPRRIAYFITDQTGLETTEKNVAKAKIFVDKFLSKVTKSPVKKSSTTTKSPVKKSSTSNVVMVKPTLSKSNKSKDKFKVGDRVKSNFTYNYNYNNYIPIAKNQSEGEEYFGKVISVTENWYDVKFEDIAGKVGFPKSSASNFLTKI
jgi:hypothetical protein